MSIRFLSPLQHSALDYTAATALLVLPFILDLAASSALALWLSVSAGLGLLGYSLLTDYRYLGNKALSYRKHLALDLTAAALFLVAPSLFGWGGVTAGYYYVMGGGVLVVVALSSTREPVHAGGFESVPR